MANISRPLKIGAILGLCLLVYLLRVPLGQLTLLLLISATIAYLVSPIQKRLPFSPGVSTGIAYLLILGVLGLALSFGIPALLRQLAGLRDAIPMVLNSLSSLLGRLQAQLGDIGQLLGQEISVQEQLFGLVGSAMAKLGDAALSLGNRLSSSGYLLLSPVLGFYMARDREKLFDALQRLIPAKIRPRTLELGLSIKAAIGAYVKGQLTVSLITGCFTAIGLLFIGVPTWLVLGLVMMVCNLIPYLGPWLGAVPVIVFSLPSGFWTTVMAFLVVLIAQVGENVFVSPRVIGQAANLHPAMVMVSLLAGSMVFGFAGLFFAIPAVLSVRATIMTIRDSRMRSVSKKV